MFDHKIVPNVPNNKGNGGIGTIKKVFNPSSYGPIDKGVWNPLSKDLLPDFSLRELYTKNPSLNIETPWYKEGLVEGGI